VEDIPAKYEGAMGVPITFLDKYNPAQFEILGITDRDNNSGLKTLEYTKEDAPNPGDLNRRGVIRTGRGLKPTYARLLIQRRRPI
jgi:Adenine-specific methyltransferase EcoRI